MRRGRRPKRAARRVLHPLFVFRALAGKLLTHVDAAGRMQELLPIFSVIWAGLMLDVSSMPVSASPVSEMSSALGRTPAQLYTR